jgi:hypothetical protein
MKSAMADATTAGWVRLLPEGEGVVVTLLSFVATPNGAPLSQRMALGLEVLDWRAQSYAERWARVVEGSHIAQPAAWAYDEFRWREAPLRPLLGVDGDGRLVVGRTWNLSRCLAASRTFNEFTSLHCKTGQDVTSNVDTERQPFAVTTPSGTAPSPQYLQRFSDALVSEIKAEMGRRGISSRALGRQVGRSSQYMSDRLDGGNSKTGRRVTLTVKDLAAIAAVFGLHPADLIERAKSAADGEDAARVVGLE